MYDLQVSSPWSGSSQGLLVPWLVVLVSSADNAGFGVPLKRAWRLSRTCPLDGLDASENSLRTLKPANVWLDVVCVLEAPAVLGPYQGVTSKMRSRKLRSLVQIFDFSSR